MTSSSARPPAAPAPAPASRRPGIDQVIAIVKAYTTRVGEGPFPTELHDDDGERLRKIGAEFGTTTGRPRRCGWYDAVIARYAARVNGVTDFVLTKLDVLTGREQIPVCVAYDVDGERYDEMPMKQTAFHHAVPVYEYFAGWTEDICGARTFADLPANAQAYVQALEEISGARIRSSASDPSASRRSCCTRCAEVLGSGFLAVFYGSPDNARALRDVGLDHAADSGDCSAEGGAAGHSLKGSHEQPIQRAPNRAVSAPA